MQATWLVAVETAADTLGEMLVEVAEGRGDHDNDEIAAAVLQSGLGVLLSSAPDGARLEEVARALFAKLHNGERNWSALTDIERVFWLDIAVAAVAAGDASLLRSVGGIAA